MPRRPTAPWWGSFAFEPSSSTSKQSQIASFLRDAVLHGRAAAGTRLPSSRILAADLRVSRQTVVLAYEGLIAEGFVVAHPGSGVAVAATLPPRVSRSSGKAPLGTVSERSAPVLSRRGRMLVDLQLTPARREPGLLAPGLPALDLFPHAVWSRLSARFWRGLPGPGRLGYTDPAGLPVLRAAIAEHLGVARGIACRGEDIVVTSGSQGAIALAAQLLLDPGDTAWVEDPAYVAGRSALAAAGACLAPIAVDTEGLDVAAGIAAAPAARLALVTPSHQYPLGVAMSLRRRLALLDWADAADSWIVEDDYDGDYRYGGRPLRPLRSLTPYGASDRVVYVGTFAKVLAPALRLGYLVAPSGLAPAFAAARALADRAPPEPLQATLADFLGEGHLNTHLRRMRLIYAERRDALLDALEQACADILDWPRGGIDAGLHLAATFLQGDVNDAAVSAAAARLGLQTPPLSGYRLRLGRPGLVMGFAATSPERMHDAARRLRRVVGT